MTEHPPTDEKWQQAEREAKATGTEYGKAAGSWVVDFGRQPGSDASAAQQVRNAMVDEGIGSFVRPLFAHEYGDDLTIADFYAACDIDPEDDDTCSLMEVAETAYYAAAEREVWRSLEPYLSDDEK